MHHNKFNAQNPTESFDMQQPAAEHPDRLERDFVPSPDEVAREAYFSYLNEGGAPGRDVQHWLKAEQQLRSERYLTRTHFQNRHN